MADDVASSAPVESLDQVGAPLRLAYAFLPNPNPIRASAAGANPNSVDLQVIVSNPTLAAVSMRQITIEIPTGDDTSRAISMAVNLPNPTLNASDSGWTITSSGSDVILTPDGTPTATVTSPPITFILRNIQVNETIGTVPLTITEVPPPPAPKAIDASTYHLVKHPADFPVTSFYADPATLTNLDQSVTLYWTCSDQGKLDGFGLRIASLGAMSAEQHPNEEEEPVAGALLAARAAAQAAAPLKDCGADGNCYTWRDGVAGVVTQAVNQTTTFALDVWQTDSAGNRTVTATLTTTVDVTMPKISGSSYVKRIFGGRVIRLHWLAFNAQSCTVMMDGETIDDAAPTDTYDKGYQILMPDGDVPHTLQVIAYAAVGGAQASFTFPEQRVTKPTRIGNVDVPGAVAISHDGALALVTTSRSDAWNEILAAGVTVIDIETWTAELATISLLPDWPSDAIAITPDGKLALVCSVEYGIRVIDVPGRTVEPAAIPVDAPGEPLAFAITTDGKTALVTCGRKQSVAVVDIASRKVETTIPTGQESTGIAITPDDKLAFVSNREGTVTVIDVATRAAEPTLIPIGHQVVPGGVAFTPDGTLALVTNGADASVSVINVAARRIEANTILTGGEPVSIVISPDGSLALTANGGSGLAIIDIARRSSVQLAWADYVTSVGITRDGTKALVMAQHSDQRGNPNPIISGNVGVI
jgi:YVTN family beta-propeller protein